MEISLSEVATSLIANFENQKVLVVGDLLLDEYVVGRVDRISPEAPVPVVRVENKWHRLGGAGNVARNIASLGGSPFLFSIVGEDRGHYLLRSLLGEHEIASQLLTDKSRPTPTKTRIMAHNQQIVRVDMEKTDPVQSKVSLNLLDQICDHLEPDCVVILSDYGKGLVSAPFLSLLEQRCAEIRPAPRILIDPKVQNFPHYRPSHLLTPNLKEAGECARMTGLGGKESILAAGEEIFKRLSCKHLLITLGPQGMAYFEDSKTVFHLPTAAQKVYDVTGAGDTVIAAVGLSLASGASELNACLLANVAASIVVKEIGTACATPTSILAALKTKSDLVLNRWSRDEG